MCLEFRCGKSEDVPALRELWQEAFGDSHAFLDTFFSVAWSARRCRVAVEKGQVVGALYWFPCSCRGQSLAYVYAVATRKESQGKGIATALMEDLNTHLESTNTAGIILVPGSKELVRFYAKRGYKPCSPQGRIKAKAAGPRVQLKAVSPRRYGEVRKELLPSGGVVQEGVNLDFLATQVRLYEGKNLLLAAVAQEDGSILGLELLCKDPVKQIPGILKALKGEEGVFRVPYEGGRPFALFRPLRTWEGEVPGYFAFAFE